MLTFSVSLVFSFRGRVALCDGRRRVDSSAYSYFLAFSKPEVTPYDLESQKVADTYIVHHYFHY
jgi:hypothetical protein